MPWQLMLDGERHSIEIIARRPELVLEIDGRRVSVERLGADGGIVSLALDGLPFDFDAARDGETIWLRDGDGRTFRALVEDPIAAAQDTGAAADEIRAPMPGSVIEIVRQPGDAVKRGDTVLTIESMKLQTNLAAPRDGVIAELLTGPGDTFGKDAVVARLQPLEED